MTKLVRRATKNKEEIAPTIVADNGSMAEPETNMISFYEEIKETSVGVARVAHGTLDPYEGDAVLPPEVSVDEHRKEERLFYLFSANRNGKCRMEEPSSCGLWGKELVAW